MAELGNPLKVLKNLGGGGQKISYAQSSNLEHTFFFLILDPEYLVFFSNKCVLCKNIYLIQDCFIM